MEEPFFPQKGQDLLAFLGRKEAMQIPSGEGESVVGVEKLPDLFWELVLDLQRSRLLEDLGLSDFCDIAFSVCCEGFDRDRLPGL